MSVHMVVAKKFTPRLTCSFASMLSWLHFFSGSKYHKVAPLYLFELATQEFFQYP